MHTSHRIAALAEMSLTGTVKPTLYREKIHFKTANKIIIVE